MFNTFLESNGPRWVVLGIALVLVGLLIFHVGYIAGARRGMPRGPGEPMRAFGVPLPHGFVEGGHGEVGTVASYAPPVLVVEDRSGTQERVIVGSTTMIEPPGATSTLSQGARVIIVGVPGQDGLDARIIRIAPR